VVERRHTDPCPGQPDEARGLRQEGTMNLLLGLWNDGE